MPETGTFVQVSRNRFLDNMSAGHQIRLEQEHFMGQRHEISRHPASWASNTPGTGSFYAAASRGL